MPPRDPERRWGIIRRTDFDQFENDEAKIFDVEWEALKSAIAEYIARYPEDFEDLGVLPKQPFSEL